MTSYLKRPVFRSVPMRMAVARLDCVACGASGQTQAAHLNQGKGMGTKNSDALLAALCWDCHAEYDQGRSMTKQQRRAFGYEMVAKTLARLIEDGVLEVMR